MHEVKLADKAIDLAPQTGELALPARALLIKFFEDEFDNRPAADIVVIRRHVLRRGLARDRNGRRRRPGVMADGLFCAPHQQRDAAPAQQGETERVGFVPVRDAAF